MRLKKRVRNLIIGKNKRIESYSEYKHVMLSGQFGLIGILLSFLYLTIDLAESVYSTYWVYALMIGLFTYSIFLHRKGKHCTANYFLLPTASIGVYLIASSEAPQGGAFIYFIILSLAAFAVFGYKQRILSILFAAFTYLLFVLTIFVDFSLLPERVYSDDMILLNEVINFTVGLPTAISIVYLMISLNHYNSIQLVGANQMLKKSNAELDRFVYSTSHDLKAPLDSIKGLIELTEHAKSKKEVAEYQTLIHNRIQSLENFIADITEVSRNSKQPVLIHPVNIYELALDVWDTLRFSNEAKGIHFEMNIPTDTIIQSDRSRLRIVLTNLISNAIRYHDREKLDPYIKLCYLPGEESFYLRVKDNGHGIAKEHQQKIFDMFFRASENSKGSGLGLFIVKETMEKLSGAIGLESEPGKGSTFTLQIPNTLTLS
ncbi:MAG: HAMP domain-containing histidine kinase [Flammeovirgaceae bacterium]|nr:HAMP domain-containing histidine kinase [Flammeovirgaceae bacterium]